MDHGRATGARRERVGWCALALGLVACGLTERSHGSADANAGGSAGASGGASEPSWQQRAELPEAGARVADFGTGMVSLHDGTAALGTLRGNVTDVSVFAERG